MFRSVMKSLLKNCARLWNQCRTRSRYIKDSRDVVRIPEGMQFGRTAIDQEAERRKTAELRSALDRAAEDSKRQWSSRARSRLRVVESPERTTNNVVDLTTILDARRD